MIVLFFAAGFINYPAQPSELRCHSNYSGEALQADFEFLLNALQQIHPDLYRMTSREGMDLEIVSIKSRLATDSLSYLQFLKTIAPLFTRIGDVNTQWGHSPAYIRFRNENIPIFPLKFKITEGKFIITGSSSTQVFVPPGTEILEINGKPVKKYLADNRLLLPIDGTNRAIQDAWLSAYFPQHHSNFWEQPRQFVLKLKNDTTGVFEVPVPAVKKADFDIGNDITKSSKPFELYFSDTTAFLKLQNFLVKDPENGMENLHTKLDSCFRVIRKNKTKQLILDIRGNGWGDVAAGSLLYSYFIDQPKPYLQQVKITPDSNIKVKASHLNAHPATYYEQFTQNIRPAKNHFDLSLIVITDGWCVDAKGLFISVIRKRPNTVLAGAVCGASAFGIFTEQYKIELPNTGISVFVPSAILVSDSTLYRQLKAVQVDMFTSDPDTLFRKSSNSK